MRVTWRQPPPPRVEVRESQPFTDAVVAAVVAAAEGSRTGNPSGLAALETAAGLYSRAFAGASVGPAGVASAAVGPRVRALIARDLIRRGESVHLIDVRGGMIELLPCGSWDVRGGWREDTWLYRVDTFGPSGNDTHFVPASKVVHVRYAVDPSRPWLGISPLGWARTTGTLAANLEQRLGEEAGAPVGSVLPIPQDGGDGTEDDPLAQLKLDLAAARGRQVLTETTAAGWGEGRGSAPQADWAPRRFGANPPAALGVLRDAASMAVLDACGVPRALAESADGTAAREAWRRFVMGACEPVANLITDELERKLETPIAFDFRALWAHDLAGRASSFKALVGGGMDVTQAAATAGLLEHDT